MAWSTPKTWSDTEDRLNSANLNRYIRDNQIALRGDHAVLAQQVAVAGYGAAMMETVTFVAGDGNKAKLTTLVPPVNCSLIYLAVRQQELSAWTAVPQVDYALWNMFTEVAADETVLAANAWPFLAMGRGDNSPRMDGFVAKGTGGVLAFGMVSGAGIAARQYDRVCVRWYI